MPIKKFNSSLLALPSIKRVISQLAISNLAKATLSLRFIFSNIFQKHVRSKNYFQKIPKPLSGNRARSLVRDVTRDAQLARKIYVVQLYSWTIFCV